MAGRTRYWLTHGAAFKRILNSKIVKYIDMCKYHYMGQFLVNKYPYAVVARKIILVIDWKKKQTNIKLFWKPCSCILALSFYNLFRIYAACYNPLCFVSKYQIFKCKYIIRHTKLITRYQRKDENYRIIFASGRKASWGSILYYYFLELIIQL